jgi:hypothetical protein
MGKPPEKTIQERMTELEDRGVIFEGINPGWNRAYCSHWPTGPKGRVKMPLTHKNLDTIEQMLNPTDGSQPSIKEPLVIEEVPAAEKKQTKVKTEEVIARVFPKEEKVEQVEQSEGNDLDLGQDYEELSLADLESPKSANEYSDISDAPNKTPWRSLTEGIKSHLDPESLDGKLERILQTIIAVNPRHSPFPTMKDFYWDPSQYKDLFPLLWKWAASFNLFLPYRESASGKPKTYYNEQTCSWVSDGKYPLADVCHLFIFGDTGIGKTTNYELSLLFLPVEDAPIPNFASEAAFQRGLLAFRMQSVSNPSLTLTGAQVTRQLGGDNEKEKSHFKVIKLGSHPSLVGRKTKNPNIGVPLTLVLKGCVDLGDMNRSGKTFLHGSVQDALKQSGGQKRWGWGPVANVRYLLGCAQFRGEIAAKQMSVISAHGGLYEIFRRALSVSANPTFPYKEHWQQVPLQSIEWEGADEWWEAYLKEKIMVLPSKGKYPLECHRVQFTVIEGKRRYPLAEKMAELQREGFLTGCLTDREWTSLYIGTEYENGAKSALTQFHLLLAAFILLEAPTVFTGLVSDEKAMEAIHKEILIAEEKGEDSGYEGLNKGDMILRWRKQYNKDFLRKLFRQYYLDFAEMLRIVVRESNAVSNGVANLTIWLQQQIDYLSSHDINNEPIEKSGKSPIIPSKERLPAGLLSQTNNTGFSLYRMALDGTAAKGFRLRNGELDPSRPPLVYNGNAAALSKDFIQAVNSLGYVGEQASGCYVLNGDTSPEV